MYNKYNILIFEGKARQALALGREFYKLGCNVSVLCNSKFDISYWSRYFNNKIVDFCSQSDEEKTKESLLKIVKKEKIDLIVPTTDFAAMLLGKNKDEFLKYTNVACNNWSVMQKAIDKNITMRICEKLQIPHPRTIYSAKCIKDILNSNINFPIIIKPRTGYGAIGFKRIDNKEKLKEVFKNEENLISQYVIQEYVPQTGIQYECAMFIDECNNVKTAVVFSKNRWFPIEGGSSTLNITVKNIEIVNECSKLLKAINWRGAADIDLIEDPRDRTIKVMEINPRVSGSVKICFEAGVNQALQMLQLAKGEKVISYDNYKIGYRLRCSQTDLLWLIKSPNRFNSTPSWFSIHNTYDQIFYIDDPLPYFAFTISGLLNYRKEMNKRK